MKRPRLTKQQALSATVLPNPQVICRLAHGKTVLELKAAPGRLKRLLRTALGASASRQVELDEIGSYVWGLCDGRRTARKLAQRVGRRYHLNSREAEVSTTTFLRMLAERGLVSFMLPEPSAHETAVRTTD